MSWRQNNGNRALVTGGAGLIGSHIVDLLLSEGWSVRILDNLEPQTHRRGPPAWLAPAAEFINADIRDRAATRAALQDIDVVFHEAAYGGYMPEIAKYVSVNSFGTAQMLELIREGNLPVKKIIVASSQAVYSEGAARCPRHGLSSRPRGPSSNCAPETLRRIARSVAPARRRRRPRRARRSAARPSTPSPKWIRKSSS